MSDTPYDQISDLLSQFVSQNWKDYRDHAHPGWSVLKDKWGSRPHYDRNHSALREIIILASQTLENVA